MTKKNTGLQFSRGSSVLIDRSSSRSSVQNPAFEFVSNEPITSVIAVTSSQSADAFLQDWHDQVGTIPSFARVITVGQSMRTTKTQTGSQNVVRPIKHPEDLTTVQMEIASALQDAPEGTIVLFDSLTPFFEHATPSEVLSFVEAVIKYIGSAEAIGYFSIDASAHDETTIVALRSRFGLLFEQDETGWRMRTSRDWLSKAESLDVLFDILRSRQRREVLRYLLFTDETSTLSELATVVAKRETNEEIVTDETHKRYSLTLSQIHLPKLDDEGYISYNPNTRSVSSREATERAKPFLTFAEE